MIYTPNTHFSVGADIDVPVAEGYTHNVGVVQAMLENVQNHTAIFNALVGNDFMELHAMHNPGALNESQVEAIHEASTGGFLQKVIDFVKKAWEKIKGFFKSFWDTIRAMLTRDNKELVNKFKSQVLKKDLSKMKYKYRKETGKTFDISKVDDALYAVKGSAGEIAALYAKSEEEIRKVKDEVSSTDFKEEMLGQTVGQSSVSASEYQKEVMDYLFEDEDTEEGLSTAELTGIITLLSESSAFLKAIKKNEEEVNKVYKKELAALEKFRTVVNKTIPSNDKTATTYKYGDDEVGTASTNDERAKLSLAISTSYAGVNVLQTVFNMASGACFNAAKFAIKQSRTVFVAAVRYNPKAVKESNVMFEHYADESNYDFDVMVEGAGY